MKNSKRYYIVLYIAMISISTASAQPLRLYNCRKRTTKYYHNRRKSVSLKEKRAKIIKNIKFAFQSIRDPNSLDYYKNTLERCYDQNIEQNKIISAILRPLFTNLQTLLGVSIYKKLDMPPLKHPDIAKYAENAATEYIQKKMRYRGGELIIKKLTEQKVKKNTEKVILRTGIEKLPSMFAKDLIDPLFIISDLYSISSAINKYKRDKKNMWMKQMSNRISRYLDEIEQFYEYRAGSTLF